MGCRHQVPTRQNQLRSGQDIADSASLSLHTRSQHKSWFRIDAPGSRHIKGLRSLSWSGGKHQLCSACIQAYSQVSNCAKRSFSACAEAGQTSDSVHRSSPCTMTRQKQAVLSLAKLVRTLGRADHCRHHLATVTELISRRQRQRQCSRTHLLGTRSMREHG